MEDSILLLVNSCLWLIACSHTSSILVYDDYNYCVVNLSGIVPHPVIVRIYRPPDVSLAEIFTLFKDLTSVLYIYCSSHILCDFNINTGWSVPIIVGDVGAIGKFN